MVTCPIGCGVGRPVKKEGTYRTARRLQPSRGLAERAKLVTRIRGSRSFSSSPASFPMRTAVRVARARSHVPAQTARAFAFSAVNSSCVIAPESSNDFADAI